MGNKKLNMMVVGLLITGGLVGTPGQVLATDIAHLKGSVEIIDQSNYIPPHEIKGFNFANGKRFRVDDTTEPVYRSIVRIGQASGFVIGKDKILTNAHVSKNVQIGENVIPGLNEEESPFGEFKVSKIDIPEEYSDSALGGNTLRFDYSVVTVLPNSQGEHIGDVVEPLVLKPTIISDLSSLGPIRNLGYPNDKGSKQLWVGPGELVRYDGGFGDEDLNNILPNIGQHFLQYDCDQAPGNSGGPVINNKNEVVGIVSLGYDEYPSFGNGSIMLEQSVIDWAQSR